MNSTKLGILMQNAHVNNTDVNPNVVIGIFYTTFMRIIVHTTAHVESMITNVGHCALFKIKCTTTKMLGNFIWYA